MPLKSEAVIGLNSGETLRVSSERSPMTEALKDLQEKILTELDHSFGEWTDVTITVKRV